MARAREVGVKLVRLHEEHRVRIRGGHALLVPFVQIQRARNFLSRFIVDRIKRQPAPLSRVSSGSLREPVAHFPLADAVQVKVEVPAVQEKRTLRVFRFSRIQRVHYLLQDVLGHGALGGGGGAG